jgi:hypothetical protein
MTPLFYIKVKVGKFFANVCSMFVRNREKRHRLRNRLDPLNPERCIRYLERHYTQQPAIAEYEGDTLQNPVWVCWLQGLEQAPALVQNCVSSIRRNLSPDQQLIIVTASNYADYVDLSPVIVDKWQRGIITNTHFSDLFRIYALARHGGCWIDATCLLTRPIPADILQSPLYIMRTHGEFSYTLIQSCFMCCRKNNYVMRKWCATMNAYWEQEDTLVNYFTLHLMFIALLQQDEQFRSLFSEMPVASDESMHLLLQPLTSGAAYSEALIDQARAATFVQKLTYKFPRTFLDDARSLASFLSQDHLTL